MDDNQTQPTEETTTPNVPSAVPAATGAAEPVAEHPTAPAAQATAYSSAPAAAPPATPAAEPAQTSEPVAEKPTTPATATPETPAAQAGPIDAKKMFYKTFSPRLFNIAFSFPNDKNRARQAAVKKGYTAPADGLVLDSGNMFWGEVLVEVQGANPEDLAVVDLTQKEVITGTSQAEMEKQAGKIATKVYTAHQGAETQMVAVF